MLKLRRVLCLFLAFLLTAQPCLAWSECGHHIIADLAFDLMKPAEQNRVLELLKHHPRFSEDFAEPDRAERTESLDHFTIGNAGYWPDIARSQPKYNRPNWHNQLGSSLTIGQNVNVPETPGPLPAGATFATKDLHITQAIELCRQTLRSKSAPESDKALAICWLAHLVADAQAAEPEEKSAEDQAIDAIGALGGRFADEHSKLTLEDTQITDAGLEYFKGLAGLRYLSVDNTQITDAGLKGLKAAMPKCDIRGK